jgi:hypothetical protein
MKQVAIYSHCRFNYQTRSGRYFAVLEYKNVIKRISGDIKGEHETPDRVVLYGLIAAVNLLKEPCALTISTCTLLRFKTPTRSPNADLLVSLISTIAEKKCTFEYLVISKREINIKTLSHKAIV